MKIRDVFYDCQIRQLSTKINITTLTVTFNNEQKQYLVGSYTIPSDIKI